jgi:amino acid permease
MNAILLAFQSDKAIKSYMEKEEPTKDELTDDMYTTAQLTASFSYRDSKTKQFLPHNDATTITRHHSSSNIKLSLSKDETSEDNSNNTNTTDNNNNLPLSEELPQRRSFMNKLFGPMEAGSIRGSIFNMVILSLGSGCLSLPKYVGKTSLALSVVMVVVIGLLVWRALNLVSRACYKKQIFIYSNLVRELYGKHLSLIYDSAVILYSFGVLILYQVIIYTLIGEAIYNLFYYNDYTNNEEFLLKSFWGQWYCKYVIPYAIGLIIIFPLCLIKDVSKLRIASLFGVITLISLIILIVVEFPSYYTYYKEYIYSPNDVTTHINIYNYKSGFDSSLYFFQYCSSLFYSFITTIGAVPIFNTLHNNILRRMQKVVRRTVLFDIVLFLVISVIGYLTWPVNTPDLIIEREKIRKGADVPMSIGRIALVLTVMMKYQVKTLKTFWKIHLTKMMMLIMMKIYHKIVLLKRKK